MNQRFINIVAAATVLHATSNAMAQDASPPSESEGTQSAAAAPSAIPSDSEKPPESDQAKPPTGKLTKPPKLVHFESVSAPAAQGASLGPTSVGLEIAIAADGKVEAVQVLEQAGEPYDALAKEAAEKFLFEPAEIDGQPAGVRLKYRYVFTTTSILSETKPSNVVEFSGQVRDKISGKPLAAVKIELDGGRLQAVTGEDGRFRFDAVDIGKHSVLLMGSSFTPVGTEEELEANNKYDVVYDVELQIEKVPDSERADFELVVIASKLEKRVETVAVSSEQATKVAGTGGDAIKVVENLPGVARSSVGSGALVVWGAGTADTRVYVEGVHVPALYHEGGFRSVVHSDLVRTVELEPGGYGASYGRGLGGLVTVGYRPLAAEGYHGSISVDAIDASAAMRGNIGEKWRFSGAARKSHLDRVLSAVTSNDVGQFVPIPQYWDAQLRLGYVPSADEAIEIGTLSSSDTISRSFVQADPLDTKTESKSTGFHRIYVNYRKTANDGSQVSVVPFYGTNRLNIVSKFGGIPAELTNNAKVMGLRASWSGPLHDKVFATVGLDTEVEFNTISRRGSVTTPPREGDIRVFGQLPDDQVNADTWNTVQAGIAPYGQLDVSLLEGKLHVIPGLRFEPSMRGGSRFTPPEGERPAIGYRNQDAFLEPRLAARMTLSSRVLVRGAVGVYHQPPLSEDLSPVFGNPQLGASKAWHYLVGSQVRILEGLTAEVTGFISQQSELVTRSPLPSPVQAQALIQDGHGRAYGAQIMLRKEMTAHLFGWVSYSIIKSERTDGGSTTYRPFDFDQTHVFTALASYDLGRGFEFGSRFRFATGYPRTPVIGAAYDARVDGYQPVFGAHNSVRIPNFYQVDARFAKLFKIGKTSSAEVYLDVQNVTNQKNPEELVYNYNYSKKSYITGLPILPVIGGKLTW